MAISTLGVTLKMGASAEELAKVVDIKDFPDMIGDPNMLETTTLSDASVTNIPGIRSSDTLTFTCNYTKTDFAKLKALEGEEGEYAVWFGGTVTGGVATPTGEDGKFEFSGSLSVYPVGGGVNEVVGMTITIAPSTPITLGE